MIWSLSEISDIIFNMKPSPTKWNCLLILLLAMISTLFVFSNFIKNLFVAKSSSRCLLVPKDTYFQWFNVALHCTVSLYCVKGKSRERITRSSADVDKLARSVKVTKHMLAIVSYWCEIVTFVFPIFDFKNVVTLKSESEVTQGHLKWYHSIFWVWFPISVLQKLCAKDTPFLRYSTSKIPWPWKPG